MSSSLQVRQWRSKYGLPNPFIETTGRIKYKKYSDCVDLYIEVETKHLKNKTPERKEGVLRYPRRRPAREVYETTKVWAHESDLYIYQEPEEFIYECATESIDDRDSCCEDHW